MHNTNDCDLREQKPANARAHLNEKKQTTEQKQNLKKKTRIFFDVCCWIKRGYSLLNVYLSDQMLKTISTNNKILRTFDLIAVHTSARTRKLPRELSTH